MSHWAQQRQRRILIIIGIILLLVGVFVFVRVNDKEPTCFDGIQNGTESGIDCGGSCSLVCRDEVRNIVVWWERPFRVSNGVYNVVAYFENQNLYSGIAKVDYEFRLYDKNNILVSQPRRGATFIEPNKRSAVFESGIVTGDTEAYTVFFKILGIQKWERVAQEFSYSFFTVGQPVLTNQDTAPKLSATIENTSYYNFTDVPVVVILYNREDNAIAASQTYLDTLDQGTHEDVFYSWPEPFGDVVARVEIIPRINPFIERASLK